MALFGAEMCESDAQHTRAYTGALLVSRAIAGIDEIVKALTRSPNG